MVIVITAVAITIVVMIGFSIGAFVYFKRKGVGLASDLPSAEVVEKRPQMVVGLFTIAAELLPHADQAHIVGADDVEAAPAASTQVEVIQCS